MQNEGGDEGRRKTGRDESKRREGKEAEDEGGCEGSREGVRR